MIDYDADTGNETISDTGTLDSFADTQKNERLFDRQRVADIIEGNP